MTTTKPNSFLLFAAAASGLAALAHLGCIIFGGDWYRFFGAGEQMAKMAEAGDLYPTIVTSVLVFILLLWALYALSGATLIKRLPLLRTALVTISLIYLTRALAFFAIMPMFPENSLTFWLVSSSICLVIGLSYVVGTYQSWNSLSPNKHI